MSARVGALGFTRNDKPIEFSRTSPWSQTPPYPSSTMPRLITKRRISPDGDQGRTIVMTIRIPRRVLHGALAVIVIAGVALAGYVVGRHSRAGLVKDLSRLQSREASRARRDARLRADELVQQRDAAQLLMNLCREVVRLPVSFGALDPASCNPGALVYMPNSPMTPVGFQTNLRQGIVTICDDVLHSEGARAFLGGCLEHYQLLPSQGGGPIGPEP